MFVDISFNRKRGLKLRVLDRYMYSMSMYIYAIKTTSLTTLRSQGFLNFKRNSSHSFKFMGWVLGS